MKKLTLLSLFAFYIFYACEESATLNSVNTGNDSSNNVGDSEEDAIEKTILMIVTTTEKITAISLLLGLLWN